MNGTLKMDDITYYIKFDATTINPKAPYYIRTGFPLAYLTDNMTKREINKIAKAMRQLGFTVIDQTKGETK